MSESDEEAFVVESLFDDAPPKLKPGPVTLHTGDGWTVLEFPVNEDGLVKRALVKSGASALDQTRVEIRRDSDGDANFFVRDRLCAYSSQAAALGAGLAVLSASVNSPLLCVLGGGGLAVPMALWANDPDASVLVVELDHTCLDLARRFFGVQHVEEMDMGNRLQIIEGDALSFVSGHHTPRPCAVLIVDIDFLRGGHCEPFWAPDFWNAAWESLLPGGVIWVNTIGAEMKEVDALAMTALKCASKEHDAVAGALEPAEERVWSAFVPRPSSLFMGAKGALKPLSAPGQLQDVLSAGRCRWVVNLASPVLEQLAAGRGDVGRWRPIQ